MTDKYQVSSATFADGAIVAMRFSLANFRNQAIIIFVAFVAVDVILMLVVYFLRSDFQKVLKHLLTTCF